LGASSPAPAPSLPPPAAADANNSSSVQVILLEVVFYNLVSFSVAFLVIALIVDWVHNSEDDEEEEEEGGDADEGGFDYEILQEGNRDLVDRVRVYVGVPLQVV
jgi:phosphate/sulfate permease